MALLPRTFLHRTRWGTAVCYNRRQGLLYRRRTRHGPVVRRPAVLSALSPAPSRIVVSPAPRAGLGVIRQGTRATGPGASADRRRRRRAGRERVEAAAAWGGR